jgi:hypothetical protein
MQKKEYTDPGGRKLVLWDKLPGKLSIAAPGEGGYVFLADKETVFRIVSDLCGWYLEQGGKNERELPELGTTVPCHHEGNLRGGISE